MEAYDGLNLEARRRIMEERARRIAMPVAAPEENPDDLTIVVFRLGREQYGLEARFVAQVARIDGATRLPGLESTVLVNLHGEILVVLDLRKVLGIEQKAPAQSARVIICGEGSSRFGIFADQVEQLTRVRASSLAASTQASELAKCVRGLSAEGITVLDGAALEANSSVLFGARMRT